MNRVIEVRDTTRARLDFFPSRDSGIFELDNPQPESGTRRRARKWTGLDGVKLWEERERCEDCGRRKKWV